MALRHPALAASAVAIAYGAVLVVLRLLPINDALVFVLMLAGVTYLLDRCGDHRRRWVLHAITQIIALSWVFSLWTVGYEGRSAVFGGILPWSDSFGFLDDALRLLHGHALSLAAKRPLYPLSLASLLGITGGNLRVVLLIFAAFGAWAVALATNAVWDSHGRKAALIVWALLLFSLRHWAGYVQTEAFGLPLGLIGFTLIWRSGRDRRAIYAGLFAITMALMARAGAFFILPALAVWAILEAPHPLRRRTALYAVAAIVAGGAMHEIVLHLAATGISFSDYPAIVFGLIHHKDYTYLAETHPALRALTGQASTVAAWQIVMAEIASHPVALITGMLRSLLELFYTPNGLFGFVWRNPDDVIFENGPALRAAFKQYSLLGPVVYWVDTKGLYSLLNGIAMGFLGICFVASAIGGLVALYRYPADPHRKLLRFALGGVLLSAPFTPPWITGAHQVEVATLAFMALVPALWWSTDSLPKPGRLAPRALIALPLGIAAALIVAALVLMPRSLTAPSASHDEPMEILAGTRVRVTAAPSLSLENKAQSDLHASLQFLQKHNRDLTDSIAPYAKPGTLYVLAYDRNQNAAMVLIDDHGLIGGSRLQRLETAPLTAPSVRRVIRALH